MAFNVRDWGSISGFAGPILVGYTLGNPVTIVAYFAEAVPQNDGASLVSNSHALQLTEGRYTHYFWVRNETSTPTSFTLSGGQAWVDFYVRDFGSIDAFQGPIFVAFSLYGGRVFPDSSLATFAMAIPQNEGASLVSTDHTVEFGSDGKFTHYFCVRNETEVPTSFIISGGHLR